ncbi:hypothetical protein R6Q57_017214 [Mikania cordata]
MGILFENQMLLVGIVVWPLVLLTLYSRAYLGYHTVAQMFADAGFGFLLDGLWFWMVNWLLQGLFPAKCLLEEEWRRRGDELMDLPIT